MMNPQNDTGCCSLARKLAACSEFLSVTLLLKEALENEDMTAVDQLIKRREELIGVIDSLDLNLGRDRHAGQFENNRQTTELVKNIKHVLLRIIQANRNCDVIAAGKCEGLRKDLMILRRKEEGLHGYARGTQQLPKFFNVRM